MSGDPVSISASEVIERGAAEIVHASESDPLSAMHVLFCANQTYLQHAAVAAVSLLCAAGSGPIFFHVMVTDKASEAERMLAETLKPFPNAKLKIYRIDDQRVSRAFVDRYLTKEAYLRFLAPEVLPPEIKRVIYLDCDVVVLDNLRLLWEMDLGGRAVGAVAECDWTNGNLNNRLTRLGIASGHVYVNSGVLLMDLDHWRCEGLAGRLFHFIEGNGSMLLFHDQDALNVVLQGDIALLDRRWNVQVLMFSRWLRNYLPEDYRATREACNNPGIIHYTTERKPWKFRTWTRKRALYYRFMDKTAWRRAKPKLRGVNMLEYQLSRALLKVGFDVYFLLPVLKRIRGRFPIYRSDRMQGRE